MLAVDAPPPPLPRTPPPALPRTPPPPLPTTPQRSGASPARAPLGPVRMDEEVLTKVFPMLARCDSDGNVAHLKHGISGDNKLSHRENGSNVEKEDDDHHRHHTGGRMKERIFDNAHGNCLSHDNGEVHDGQHLDEGDNGIGDSGSSSEDECLHDEGNDDHNENDRRNDDEILYGDLDRGEKRRRQFLSSRSVIIPRTDMTIETQKRIDQSVEKHCKVIFDEEGSIAFPCGLIALPYELRWDPHADLMLIPTAEHLDLAVTIGESLLEINKATARLSFWLMLKRHLSTGRGLSPLPGSINSGGGGGAFKTKLKEWLRRARIEPAECVAVEIVTEIGCGIQYVGVCREMLEMSDCVSNARAYIRNPLNAATEAIRKATDTLLGCFSSSNVLYLYLVDEFTGLPHVPLRSRRGSTPRQNAHSHGFVHGDRSYSQNSMYPLRIEENTHLVEDIFLPFINITLMSVSALDGLASVAALVGLPPAFGIPPTWFDAEPGMMHCLDDPSSIAELAVLQGMIRKKERAMRARAAAAARAAGATPGEGIAVESNELGAATTSLRKGDEGPSGIRKKKGGTNGSLIVPGFADDNTSNDSSSEEQEAAVAIPSDDEDCKDDRYDFGDSDGKIDEEDRGYCSDDFGTCKEERKKEEFHVNGSNHARNGEEKGNKASRLREIRKHPRNVCELRKLEIFYREYDPIKMFSDLRLLSDGKAASIWTSDETIEAVRSEAELARTEYRLKELRKEWERREVIGKEIERLAARIKGLRSPASQGEVFVADSGGLEVTALTGGIADTSGGANDSRAFRGSFVPQVSLGSLENSTKGSQRFSFSMQRKHGEVIDRTSELGGGWIAYDDIDRSPKPKVIGVLPKRMQSQQSLVSGISDFPSTPSLNDESLHSALGFHTFQPDPVALMSSSRPEPRRTNSKSALLRISSTRTSSELDRYRCGELEPLTDLGYESPSTATTSSWSSRRRKRKQRGSGCSVRSGSTASRIMGRFLPRLGCPHPGSSSSSSKHGGFD